MSKTFLGAAFFMLLAASAAARQESGKTSANYPVPIVVDEKVCRRIAELAPSVDGASYRSGIDVAGRPVVPAEGPGAETGAGLPNATEIEIVLTKEYVRQHGLKTEARLGILRLTADGGMTLNGTPLGDSQTALLRNACARMGKRDGVSLQGKQP